MIGSYALVLATAAGVTWVLVPLAMRLARRLGAVVAPGDRHIHTRPTPTMGGLAMFVGMLAGLGVASSLDQFHTVFESPANVIGVVAAATVMFGSGLIDDLRDVSAPAKVAGMVLSGSILLLSGNSIVNVPLPFFGFTVLTQDLAALVTVIWVVGIANAVNLIDGLDGLATGLMVIASGSFLLYAIRLDQAGALFTGNIGPLLLVIILGMCLGFLPWNFHPAKVFMGDSGALLLGLLMASSTIAVGGQSDDSFTGQSWFFFAPLVIPLVILGIPVLDVIFAVLRRATRRSGLANADKDHLHHRLLRLGHGYRQTVVILWLWTGLLSAFALYPAWSGKGIAMIPIAVAALVLLLFTMLAPWFGRRNVDGASVAEEPPVVVDVTGAPAARDHDVPA